MAQIATVKANDDIFAGASGAGKTDPLTSQIMDYLRASTVGGDDIKLTLDTAKEARGIGRRVTYALKELKMAEDSVILSRYNGEVAEALEAKKQPIERFIRRVK